MASATTSAMAVALLPTLILAAAASPSPHQYTYTWKQGAMGAGNDVEPASLRTIDEAQQHCSTLPRCRGFTYEGTNSTSAEVKVYFKSDAGSNGDADWSAWTKVGTVTPPALSMAVGGTSGLTLSLRQDTFTVQNLTAVGRDGFSFTRPLTEASALPLCSFLGDVTLRVALAEAHAARGNAAELPMGATDWVTLSSAYGGVAKPLPLPPRAGRVLAAQDLTELLAASASNASGDALPAATSAAWAGALHVTRSYETSTDGEALVLRFNVSNVHPNRTIVLGGVGFPLPEVPASKAGIQTAVWADPAVAGEHGHVAFVRVVDGEDTLVVTGTRTGALGASPYGAALEAWRPVLEDLGPGDVWEWCHHSEAWASEWATGRQAPFVKMAPTVTNTGEFTRVDTPWPATDGRASVPITPAAAHPWNPPTRRELAPGEVASYALRLQRADGGPRSRDAALARMGAAVVRGVPGFVLSPDMSSAAALVKPPPGANVTQVVATPVPARQWEGVFSADASLSIGALDPDPSTNGAATRGFVSIPLRAVAAGAATSDATARGRVRLAISFSDGTSAVAHYHVVPPMRQQVAALGAHFADVAWLPRGFPDPFGRSASVMPWDRELGEHILNDARAYDVGLSDDAGGGNPLGFASKVRAAPTQHEVDRLDDFIEWTLYGVKPDVAKPPLRSLQLRPEDGGNTDGIRMTMFYYADDGNGSFLPSSSGHFDWNYTELSKCKLPYGGPTWCMTENMANATYRGFNVPHHTASYWAMYHVARHYDKLRTRRSWRWYLERMAKTALHVGSPGTGLMDGTVFREVLVALQEEAAADSANATLAQWSQQLTQNMQRRQQQWALEPYPYGSEFGFDTTGQEEVVVWNLFFGNETAAKKTVDHILSYMRQSSTWAYNGGSRSWGDAGNNAKWLPSFGTGSAPRGQMHYRSGLNMIPLIEYYRAHPDDTALLEISMGAIVGQLVNIDSTGATSMMWHALPHVNEYDPHSGDYGLGFFGHSLESGAYYVRDALIGEQCYLCDIGNCSTQRENSSTHTLGVDTTSLCITPRDSYRSQVFIEPLALYLQAQAGTFASIELNFASRVLRVAFDAESTSTTAPFTKLRLKLDKTATTAVRPGTNFRVVQPADAVVVRSAYVIDPRAGADIEITWDG